MSSHDMRQAWRVGPWTVEPELHRITGEDGRSRTLEPKLIQILVCLAKARGRVVSKEELLADVWDGNHVSESALTRGISELRRALGDDASAPKVIETIPKHGYRTVAPVERVPGNAGSTPRGRSTARLRGWGLAATSLAAVALVFLVAGWRRDARLPAGFVAEPPPLDRARLAQITTATDLEAFPDISPDGTRLVYSRELEGRMQLVVRQLVPGGSDLPLTPPEMQAVQGQWSPDGQLIAFHSVAEGGIWVVASQGGEPRRVTDLGSAPSWLRDSRRLVYQSSALVEIKNYSPALAPSVLLTVDVSGGRPRALTRQDEPPGGHGAPRVSPDGTRILFAASDVAGGALYTMKVDGSDVRAVAGAPMSDATFAADGRGIFSVGMFSGERWLWHTRIDPDSGEALALPERVARGHFRGLDVHPDGRQLVSSLVRQWSNIFRLDLPSSREDPREGVESRLTHGTNLRNSSPTVSPDGTRVAYRHRRVGQLDQVWWVGTDGSDNAQLTLDTNVSAHFPSFSEDGEEVLFQTVRGNLRELRRISVKDRRATTWLELPRAWRSVRLSPDEQALVFHMPVAVERAGRSTRANNVFRARVDDLRRGQLRPEPLTSRSDFAGFAVLSPTQRTLAYEVNEGDGFQLTARTLPRGEPRQLTSEGQNWPGAFVRENELAFVAQRDGVWNQYLLNLETGEETRLTDNAAFSTYYRNPAVAQGHDFLVYEKGRVVADLWAVELPPVTAEGY